MNKRIPIFQLTFDSDFREKFFAGAQQILDEGYLGNHTFVREFEKEFAKSSGTKYALGVPNGTAAIELPLRSIGVKGKNVLLGTNTFVATAVAITNAGGTPIPIEIDEEFYGLSPESLTSRIDESTGAVVVIHIAGLITPKIEEIRLIL